MLHLDCNDVRELLSQRGHSTRAQQCDLMRVHGVSYELPVRHHRDMRMYQDVNRTPDEQERKVTHAERDHQLLRCLTRRRPRQSSGIGEVPGVAVESFSEAVAAIVYRGDAALFEDQLSAIISVLLELPD